MAVAVLIYQPTAIILPRGALSAFLAPKDQTIYSRNLLITFCPERKHQQNKLDKKRERDEIFSKWAEGSRQHF